MAGMIVQHNLNAINANNKLNINVLGTKKSTEKLSSGFRINRAADDAAGLAISEKMRAQIRGIGQAIRNSNDGISLIQTAEGALDETHDMLKRLKELAVQAGNETYSDEERKYMQDEIDKIKEEVDRISKATDFNGIKLLDGSLGGSAGTTDDYGARYGIKVTSVGGVLSGSSVTTSLGGVTVQFGTAVSGVGGEYASWSADAKTLTINLNKGTAYTQAQIDALVANANVQKGSSQTAAVPTVSIKLNSGVITLTSASVSFGATVAGVRATAGGAANNLANFLVNSTGGTDEFANTIKFTSNSYGKDTRQIKIATDADGGKENVTVEKTDDPNQKNGQFTLHLATGIAYSEQDIQNLLAKSGYGLDYSVELTSKKAPDGDAKFQANQAIKATNANALALTMGNGAGLGKDSVAGAGNGLTLQIGANNAVEQRLTVSIKDMSASAIGIGNISVRTVRDAQEAMDKVTGAITNVSAQRAALGAIQNRLEHTVNSLTVSSENLTAAEAQIRDTDMATEMVNYTKFAILQQAAQAMLAQANQAPQAVLQLLQ